MMSNLLSKSRYCLGLQCAKLLWVDCNDKRRLPEPDAAAQARMKEGEEIGEWAKKIFPQGIEIPQGGGNLQEKADATAEVLDRREAVFEAAFIQNGIYAQTDILVPVEYDEKDSLDPELNGAWNIIEVKSSTKLHEYHTDDVAFQKACCESAGVKINRCFIMHLNGEYIRGTDIVPGELLTMEEITDDVIGQQEGVQENIERMLEIMGQTECPEIQVGTHCSDPSECPLQDECWSFLPENNVTTLYGKGPKKVVPLIRKGIYDIADFPDEFPLSQKATIQKECVLSGKPYVNTAEIQAFLDRLKFPQYHLDFETIGLAIPPYEGTWPYQQIPFQFSLHIWNSFDSEPEHFEFLADGKTDPRPELLASLKEHIGPKGDIVVYNHSFEETCLRQAAGTFPEYETFVSDLNSRIVDLMEPFRAFHYYHPAQKGKVSLKSVLPVLAPDLSYADMEIGDGGTASTEYARVTFGDVPETERQRAHQALLRYCHLDTLAMIRIIQGLKESVK